MRVPAPQMGVDDTHVAEANLDVGDLVGWIASGGMTTGRVVRILTSPERIGPPGLMGDRVRASEDAPWFLVESELGGDRRAYRRASLTRL